MLPRKPPWPRFLAGRVVEAIGTFAQTLAGRYPMPVRTLRTVQRLAH